MVDEFVNTLTKAIAENDYRTVDSVIDWNLLYRGVIDSLSFDRQVGQQLHSKLLQSVTGEDGYTSQINSEGPENTSYELVRTHSQNGVQYALFRLYGDEGLNYHDYRLVKRGKRAVAIDVYVYQTGENMSETMRRTLLPASRQNSKNWLEKLASSDRAFLEKYDQIDQMSDLVNGGNGVKAIRVYRNLPEEIQRLKVVQIMRYEAATLAGDEEVLAAARDYKRLYPNDPSLALMTIDGLIVEKNFDEAIAAVDQLDKLIGGDPWLDFLRCSIYLEEGDQASAIESVKSLVRSYPEQEDYYFMLLELFKRNQDYAAMAKTLTEIEKQFDSEWGDLMGESYLRRIRCLSGRSGLAQRTRI